MKNKDIPNKEMKADKRIYQETFQRSFAVESRAFDDDKRTVDLAFSSEEPVERWFGVEILDHSKGAVDTSRLNEGAALLVNHDSNQQVGVVESARVDDDRKARATVRFGRSAKAEEVWNDVKDGIRKLVSVGYRILETVITERKDGSKEPDEFRVTRWQPMEISLVAVPADASVGIGRSVESQAKKGEEMSDNKDNRAAPDQPANEPAKAPQPSINIESIREEARKAEFERQSEIRAAAENLAKFDPAMREEGERAIKDNMSADQFRQRAMGLMKPSKPASDGRDQPVGMNEREIQQYSFCKAILGASNGKLDGLEREASEAYEKRCGQAPQSFWIPPDVVLGSSQKRDLSVGTASLGGNLVATNLLAGSFIELLRNRMVASRLGVTFLTGLVGNVAIPRQTASAGASWMASEVASAAEGNATFDQVTLQPYTLHARQDLTKQLIQQATPSIEQLVRNDLATSLALAWDLSVITGTDTSQPLGILNVSGTGSSPAANSANGAAPTWADVVELESDVAAANADMGALAYLTHPNVRGTLKTTEKATNTAAFIWADRPAGATPGEGEVNGYRALVSSQIPTNLTAGTSTTVCTAMIFGNWSDYIIAQWGGIDVLVNPYTQASTRVVEVHTHLFADGDVRHAESFSTMENIV